MRRAPWPSRPLRDVGDWSGGGTPSKAREEYWTNGTIPWVTPKDMKVETITGAEDLITADAVAGSATKLVPPNSVLVVVRSGILQRLLPVAVTACEVTINQDLKAVQLRPWIRPRYLAMALKAFEQDILQRCTKSGTTVQNINMPALLDYTIPVAPVEQQDSIVAEIETQFTRLDAGVAALQRAQANLKRYRASVLKAACEGRLVPTEAELARREGRDYETGAQLLERILAERRKAWTGKGKYKEPEPPDTTGLPELPEGWCWASVGQLADVGTGATPKRGVDRYWSAGSVPWVTSAALNDPYVDVAGECVTEHALAETNLTIYQPGTLLIAMYGEGKTRGKCAELRLRATTNQAIAALECHADVRRYLKLLLWHQYEAIRSRALGGAQPNLNLSMVRSIVVAMPPEHEQTRVCAEVDRLLSGADQLGSIVDGHLQRVVRLRLAVLQRAFGGV